MNTFSFGFGGHVSLSDIEETAHDFTADPVLNAGIRELREELYLNNKIINLKHLGYVRELTSKTSNHLGSVFLLTTGFAGIKEKDKLKGKWISYDDLKYSYYNVLESWSRAVLDYIYSNDRLKKELNL